jgi:hypothetical protein
MENLLIQKMEVIIRMYWMKRVYIFNSHDFWSEQLLWNHQVHLIDYKQHEQELQQQVKKCEYFLIPNEQLLRT